MGQVERLRRLLGAIREGAGEAANTREPADDTYEPSDIEDEIARLLLGETIVDSEGGPSGWALTENGVMFKDTDGNEVYDRAEMTTGGHLYRYNTETDAFEDMGPVQNTP